MAQSAVNTYKIVVIGGSAGSLNVVMQIIAALPTAAGLAYVLVLHRKTDIDSILTELLSTRTTMPVREVEDKDLLDANTVYIAPPDYHLLIENKNTFALDSSEKVHFSRPSIDVTFQSAADVFGAGVVGILLSGANADGAVGLEYIYQHHGFTIVQDPSTAEVGYMPAQALQCCRPSAVVNGAAIGSYLYQLMKA